MKDGPLFSFPFFPMAIYFVAVSSKGTAWSQNLVCWVSLLPSFCLTSSYRDGEFGNQLCWVTRVKHPFNQVHSKNYISRSWEPATSFLMFFLVIDRWPLHSYLKLDMHKMDPTTLDTRCHRMPLQSPNLSVLDILW